MKKMQFRLQIVLVGLAALAVTLAGVACSSEDKGPIVLIEQDWDGQLVTTAVAKILLEEEMGVEVVTKFAPADSATMYVGLQSGDFDFVCCAWLSASRGFEKDFIDDRGTVERLGTVGVLGSQGWFVPRYVVEGDSSRGITATAPNLRSYQDLNEYAELFATSDTGDKGRILDFQPAWDNRNAERIDAMGLNFQVGYSGSEGASFAELDAHYRRGDPLLLHMWAPHWTFAKYDMVQIELPPSAADCYPAGENYFCGWASEQVMKLASTSLKDEFPKAYEFLQNFTITNDQQNEMVFAVTDEGKEIAEAAQDWIDANKSIWQSWIP